MPSIPPCDPMSTAASSGPPPFVYLAAAVGVGKVVGDVLGYKAPDAITGYQHVQAGGKYMDKTLEILNDEKKGMQALSPAERRDYIERHDALKRERIALDDKTRSYLGSARNWNDSRKFHDSAYSLHTQTRISSDDGVSRRVAALARQQDSGEQQYIPPGYPYEPTRHPKKHDDANGSANAPWASWQGQNSSSSHSGWQAAQPHGHPQYPQYGQPQQHYSPPPNHQAPHPNMTSSQWAQHTAAASNYPPNHYPPSSKRHGRY